MSKVKWKRRAKAAEWSLAEIRRACIDHYDAEGILEAEDAVDAWDESPVQLVGMVLDDAERLAARLRAVTRDYEAAQAKIVDQTNLRGLVDERTQDLADANRRLEEIARRGGIDVTNAIVPWKETVASLSNVLNDVRRDERCARERLLAALPEAGVHLSMNELVGRLIEELDKARAPFPPPAGAAVTL